MACDLEMETACPQEREVLRSPSSQISCPGGWLQALCPGGGLRALWQEQPVQVQLLEIFTGINKNPLFLCCKIWDKRCKYLFPGDTLRSLMDHE